MDSKTLTSGVTLVAPRVRKRPVKTAGSEALNLDSVIEQNRERINKGWEELARLSQALEALNISMNAIAQKGGAVAPKSNESDPTPKPASPKQ